MIPRFFNQFPGDHVENGPTETLPLPVGIRNMSGSNNMTSDKPSEIPAFNGCHEYFLLLNYFTAPSITTTATFARVDQDESNRMEGGGIALMVLAGEFRQLVVGCGGGR